MSVQSQLVSFIQKQNGLQRKTNLWFKNMYFCWIYSDKMKMLSILGTGYFLKITKTYSQQEKQICPNCTIISFRKHKKSPIHKNFMPHGITLQ